MWILLSTLLLAAGPEVELKTADGRVLTGALTQIAADNLSLDTANGPVVVPLAQVLVVASQAKPGALEPAKVWLQLVDGSELTGQEYRVTRGQADLKLSDGQVVKVATRLISHVRFKDQSEKIAGQWQEIVSSRHATDVIVIRREDSIDFLEGALGDVDDKEVQFTLDGDKVPVKLPRVEGLLYFHPPGKELPSPLCQLHGHDGSRLEVQKLAMSADVLQVTTVAGVSLSRPLSSVRDLDFSLGKVRYLSDLPADSAQYTPFFGAFDFGAEAAKFYEPRLDRNFEGGPLKLGKKSYVKGLSIKSRTKLVYRLPSKFSKLEALVGIDAGVAPLGNVRLLISGDDKLLHEATVRGSDAPLPLSLDIAGVKRLTIEVDFGEGGDVGDYLNLCEARIIQ